MRKGAMRWMEWLLNQLTAWRGRGGLGGVKWLRGESREMKVEGWKRCSACRQRRQSKYLKVGAVCEKVHVPGCQQLSEIEIR